MTVEKVQSIGILGGTFNPIHTGHLIVAQMVRDKFKLDNILFIPSGMPPHKDLNSVVSAQHRFEMVKAAVESNEYFVQSSIEIDRDGYTYTVDTLKKLKEMYGNNTSCYYIIGADVLFELLTWRSYEEVFKLCEFIAVLRPGSSIEDFNKQMEYLKNTHDAKIHFINTPLIEISSTQIRDRVKAQESIKYLVPDAVEEYIRLNGLYIE